MNRNQVEYLAREAVIHQLNARQSLASLEIEIGDCSNRSERAIKDFASRIGDISEISEDNWQLLVDELSQYNDYSSSKK